MSKYTRKQFVIAVIFILILVMIAGGVWLLVRPPKATCFDGIQNQEEDDIDCGGPCNACDKPIKLKILYQDFIPTTDGSFDFVAKVKNPNSEWGIEFLRYRFYMFNQNDEQVGFKEGNTYILPQEEKYFVEQRIEFPKLGRIELRIDNINWKKLKDFNELDLKIKNSGVKLLENNYTQAFGVVENKSNFNLDRIEVIGLILDNDKIIAAGKTDMRTVLIGEERYFEITWPYEVSANSFELKAYTNIFLDDNFMKEHGIEESLREY
jgi:hypothetical protein